MGTRAKKDPIMPITIEDIRNVVKEEIGKALKEELNRALEIAIAPVNASLATLTTSITDIKNDITAINNKHREIEASLQFQDTTLKQYETMFQTMKDFVVDIATNLSMYVLDMDAHSRKWSIMVQGLPGVGGESESVTRQKCADLGKKIKVQKPFASTNLAACHRLSQGANAGIIIRFTDLKDRNDWLAKARNLEKTDKISISPDLPPKVRILKTNALNERKQLPAEDKRASKIKHLKSWPFIELIVNGEKRVPACSKLDVVRDMIGIENIPSFQLSTDV